MILKNLLALFLQFFGSSPERFSQCNNAYTLPPDSVTILNSPYYPNKYPSGSSCLYAFVAPLDYEIVAECNINIDRNANGCDSEQFYVSREADRTLTTAEQFCGSGNLTRTTLFRHLVIAYTSEADPKSGIGGTFTCRLTTRPQACDCGWSMETRIVGGVEASKLEFPSMVGLYYEPAQTIFCGGSIINHRTIVSAAHCTRLFQNPNEVAILAGHHSSDESGAESPYAVTYSVYEYIEHPEYDPSNGDYDIVLLITNNIIEWSRGVGPICLPLDQLSNNFNWTNVTLTGWGTTSFAGVRPNALQKTSVNVIPNSVCQRVYSSIESSQMCTYYQNRDSCQFDSGGPVVYRGPIRQYLLGVIGFGLPCGTEPSVNARITASVVWILRNSAGNVCFKPFLLSTV